MHGMNKLLSKLTIIAAAALICGGMVYHRHPHAVKAAVCRIIPGKTVHYSGEDILYADTFNDLNRKHLSAAAKVGLKEAPESRKDIDKDLMTKISTCRDYWVDPLPHSMPYLMPGSAEELSSIGHRFREILDEEGLPSYRIIITSILRTGDDVENLQETNINASGNSAHCYGTTFDISWSRFDKVVPGGKTMTDADLKNVLGEVLKEERKLGHIYVKYEIRQKCFHITSRI